MRSCTARYNWYMLRMFQKSVMVWFTSSPSMVKVFMSFSIMSCASVSMQVASRSLLCISRLLTAGGTSGDSIVGCWRLLFFV